MRIAIVGSGYVGLCSAVGFASLGHDVTCIDVDKVKVQKINRAEAPIYEKGLDKLLLKSVKAKKISATDSLKNIQKTGLIFIAVGTPSNEDGGMNLNYIEKTSADIGEHLKTSGYCTVVVKSTVLPGTTEQTIIPVIEEVSGKKAGKDFGICMNPEFLREGRALEDFFNPDRIVIGQYDKKSGKALLELYKNFKCPIKTTELKTAELIKYASNAFLATKISFINEIGNLCKALGIDAYEVADGMGLDKRIGKHFLRAGIGFGGSCLGKDVSALLYKSKEQKSKSRILEAILQANDLQPLRIVTLLESKIKLENKTIAILGLAFKEDTDDIRDAPSIQVIRKLLDYGCKLRCYDPKANENMRKMFPEAAYFGSAKEALKTADACLVLTGWDEFRNLTDQDFSVMKNKIIVEGRRILDRKKATGFEGICW